MRAQTAKYRILLFRDDGFPLGEDEVSEVAQALADQPDVKVVESPAAYGEAARAIEKADVDMVIVDEVAGDPAALVEQLDYVAPDLPIIVMLAEDQRALAQPCILAGARAYLFRPFEPNDLLEVIRRIHAKEDRRRKQRRTPTTKDGGRIVVVHGAKGGVGTTTVAVNVAVAARRLTNQRVALVDSNLMRGDVGVALNVVSDNSVADVVAHLRDLDADLLDDSMVRHESGVSVLLSPAQFERAEVIGGDDMAAVLAACRAHYDLVVVDTASYLDEHVIMTLDSADAILLICTPELAALKNTARFLRLGNDLGYASEKIKLVVNRLGSAGALDVADIEQNLGHKMSYGLVSDGMPIVESLNSGEPVVTLRPRSRAARQLHELASDLLGRLGLAGEAMPAEDSSLTDAEANRQAAGPNTGKPKTKNRFGWLGRLRTAAAR